jgi:hypothetical protein
VNGKKVDIRAAAGNMTHNVKIVGNGAGTSGHNGHVMITEFTDYDTTASAGFIVRTGSAQLSNVEFIDIG